MPFLDFKLVKFLIVGVANTLVGCGIMFLFYNVFNFSYWTSSISNYIFGGIVSYFLNKYFTFQNRQKNIFQIFLFILNLLICYLIAYIGAKQAILFLLKNQSTKVQENIAMLVGMCFYTILNYFGQRYIVFNGGSKK